MTLPTAEIVEHRLDLLAHEGRIERDDAAHLGRVLRGDRGQRARAVHAQRGERLEVGLHARAATRVRSGDSQRRRWGLVRHRATIGGHRGMVVRVSADDAAAPATPLSIAGRGVRARACFSAPVA